jgi:hypothetical protein
VIYLSNFKLHRFVLNGKNCVRISRVAKIAALWLLLYFKLEISYFLFGFIITQLADRLLSISSQACIFYLTCVHGIIIGVNVKVLFFIPNTTPFHVAWRILAETNTGAL